MKSKITFYASILITCLFLTSVGTGYVTARPQQQAGVSFSAFYDALSPYGQWMNYGNYGQVWIPDAGQDFRPYYTNGHWVYTDYGWTWMSDYPWGWAPFHYGRWTHDNYYGWMWVPGEEWGPAWVSWRNNNDYYGWAPLTPGVSVGVNVNIGTPHAYWSFVPCRYINSPNIHNYYVDRSRNVTIINNTTIINNVRVVNRNTSYYRGPEAREVSRITRTPVTPVRVVNSDRPGNARVENNQVRIFRPQGSELRRPLADNRTNNNSPRRTFNDNDGRVTPAPNNNNNVSAPGTPGRTRRVFDNNNNNPVNNTPAPNTNPADRNNNMPRRTFNNDNRPAPAQPNVNPAPTQPRVNPAPNNNPAPAPERNNATPPRRIFSEPNNNRPTPAPAPSQPRPNPAPQPQPRAPQPQPRVNPAPQPQPQRSNPAPQRTFSNPRPAPAPRAQQQQPSAPRPQAAPQRSNNNGRINRDQR